MQTLFMQKRFTMHSGGHSDFKIECNALTKDDLNTLAFLISRKFHFNRVYGIPTGGIPLQNALEPYINPNSKTTLIVDDVFTTGNSMKTAHQTIRRQHPKLTSDQISGIVIFARGKIPDWITPIFTLESIFWQND